MGYHFELDSGNKIFRCAWQGRVTDEHLFEAFSVGVRLLASHPSSRLIDDYSGVTELDVSTGTIEGLGRMQHVPKGGIDSTVVVIAPKDVVFGLARMFMIINDQIFPNVHVVRTAREAYALLGVTAIQFNSITGPYIT